MKKGIGLLMKFVPIIFLFISANIGHDKSTPSLPQVIYMLIAILMCYGILAMLTDKNKIPVMTNWTRVADIILLLLFVITATNDFLHRHDANVTTLNSALMLFCCTMIYLHEKVRERRVAKLLAATKEANPKRGLGESAITS